MRRTLGVLMAVSLVLVLVPAASGAGEAPVNDVFTPGAPGIGDPYFPLDGNGGYDVDHYLLQLGYDPATDVLTGVATVEAVATQNLSAFNLDLTGLTVRSVTVDDNPADWSRRGGELTITPSSGLPLGETFVTVIAYDGIPETLPDASGFFHTDDGALVVGQPAVADTWFPANDHPLDKASFTFEITAPTGLEVLANGILDGSRSAGAGTTWVWDAEAPMAPYLAMMAIGEFDVDAYRIDRLRVWDALDPDLFAKPEARTGDQFAYSQQADDSYKRLSRTISVPVEGAEFSFFIDRDTEADWDYVFVEAHTVGADDWTTLEDLNGHTTQDTGFSCPGWHGIHPFLEHYQSGSCAPTGTTGAWWAASGASDGYEQWVFDLAAYAGSDVEVSISYASDELIQLAGVAIDDVEVSTGEGSTSFEDDGDTVDGWTIPGPPEGSPGNDNDWIVTDGADLPPSLGEVAAASFARQGEIIAFLEERFGGYPFNAAGGIVDDLDEFGFALENQTRPIYAKYFFDDPVAGDSVVVHEIAHQWYGDSLALAAWQHIWLNEGFASYAEWLWSEAEGLGTAQEIFDALMSIPARSSFWDLTIGDPGPNNLFAGAVYARGAGTLHALRLTIGDDAFFALLRRWATIYRGDNVTTDQFIAMAEDISGQELDELFDIWLFTPSKPARPIVDPSVTSDLDDTLGVARNQLAWWDKLGRGGSG